METISVKNAILRRFGDADLSLGILRSLRHHFYDASPETFPFKSIRSLLKSLDWPQDYLYLGEYPKDRELAWTEWLQGLTHDSHNWFITQGDTLWKIPVALDLDEDFDVDNLPDGVLKTGYPPGDEFKDYDHFGSPDYYDGFLYVPFEALGYLPLLPKVLVFEAETLRFVSSTDLATQGNGHAPWCAINPLNGFLYSSANIHSPDNGYLYIYRRELQGGKLTLDYLGSFELFDEQGARITVRSIQGGTFSRDGQLYLVIDTKDENAGVYGFDMVTGRKMFYKSIRYNEDFDPWGGEELEGITIWDLQSGDAPHILGQIHLFRRDIDALTDNVYFKHFKEVR